MTLSWNCPICEFCWIDQEAVLDSNGLMTGIRRPAMVVDPPVEMCAWCGNATIIGIYKRADPKSVKYPREEPELD